MILESITEKEVLDRIGQEPLDPEIKEMLVKISKCCRRASTAVFEPCGCAHDNIYREDRFLLSSIFLPMCGRDPRDVFQACEKQARHRLRQAYAKIQHTGNLYAEEEIRLSQCISWLSNLHKLVQFAMNIYTLPKDADGEPIMEVDFEHWKIFIIPSAEIKSSFKDFIEFRRVIQRSNNPPLYKITRNRTINEESQLYVEFFPQFLEQIGDIKFTIRDGNFIAVPEELVKKLDKNSKIFGSLPAPENKE